MVLLPELVGNRAWYLRLRGTDWVTVMVGYVKSETRFSGAGQPRPNVTDDPDCLPQVSYNNQTAAQEDRIRRCP